MSPTKGWAVIRIDREISGIALSSWYAAAFLLILLAPSELRLASSLLALPATEQLQMWVWGTVFLAFSLMTSTVTARGGRVSIPALCAIGAGCWGAGYAVLHAQPDAAASRLIAIGAAGSGMFFAVLPLLLRRRLLPASMFLWVAVAGIAGLGLASPRRSSSASRVVTTAVHQLSATYIPQLVDSIESDGGAIDVLDDGFLLVTGEGEFYRLAWDSSEAVLRSVRLAPSAPLNRRSYLAEHQNPRTAQRLRVTDVLVDTAGTPRAVFVAHQHWNADAQCFTMRVSSIPLAAVTATAETPVVWSVVYETHPCLAVTSGFDDIETGGRLAMDAQHRLLFSVGDHGSNGLVGPALSQDATSDYGKILLLDERAQRVVFSIGHRNPQGLMVDRAGRVWSTEHGPEGGDELNALEQGRNYGWPFATYGTAYGSTLWPLAVGSRNHESFAEPTHVFVPSIGIGNLIELGPREFPGWEGDLLVASLAGMSLLRVRMRGDRVTFVEPIRIGRRLRDLAEGPDGRIVLWTDEGDVVVLARLDVPTTGEALYAGCSSCHGSRLEGTALGPALAGIVGRRVAAQQGFGYSAALARVGGEWTPERLDTFLESPERFAPGTAMAQIRVADASARAALIEYLRTFR